MYLSALDPTQYNPLEMIERSSHSTPNSEAAPQQAASPQSDDYKRGYADAIANMRARLRELMEAK